MVDSYRYLGHFISYNFKDSKDVELRLNNFYASFNSVLRDFSQVNSDTHMFLFNSYCKPDYGLALWNNDKTFKSQIFKTLEVAFSKAIKKIYKVPPYASNHITASRCNQLLLKHHVSLVQARYYKRLLRSQNVLSSVFHL